MDTFCPFLGAFGRGIIKFRHILTTMDETARTVYRDRQAFVANELATQESIKFRKTDMLSNLGRFDLTRIVDPTQLTLNSKSGVEGF